jgi:hypothetical protein
VGGEKTGLPANAQCLSCVDKINQTPEELVSCLKTSIAEVVPSREVEIRQEDLQDLSRQVRNVLRIHREVAPIDGLKTVSEINSFLDFVDAVENGR